MTTPSPERLFCPTTAAGARQRPGAHSAHYRTALCLQKLKKGRVLQCALYCRIFDFCKSSPVGHVCTVKLLLAKRNSILLGFVHRVVMNPACKEAPAVCTLLPEACTLRHQRCTSGATNPRRQALLLEIFLFVTLLARHLLPGYNSDTLVAPIAQLLPWRFPCRTKGRAALRCHHAAHEQPLQNVRVMLLQPLPRCVTCCIFCVSLPSSYHDLLRSRVSGL